VNGDGYLTVEELRHYFAHVAKLDMSEHEIEDYVTLMDTDKDGLVSWPEYRDGTVSQLNAMQQHM